MPTQHFTLGHAIHDKVSNIRPWYRQCTCDGEMFLFTSIVSYIPHYTLPILSIGSYKYMNDLLYMESQYSPFSVAQELVGVNSPLLPYIANWDAYLRNHPNEHFKEYILRGIREGFRIGFDWSNQLSLGKCNILSVSQKPQLVEEYIAWNVQRETLLVHSHPLNYPTAKLTRSVLLV